jgi:hypothetical protein
VNGQPVNGQNILKIPLVFGKIQVVIWICFYPNPIGANRDNPLGEWAESAAIFTGGQVLRYIM